MKKKNKKRKQLTSLLAMMIMIFVAFIVVGLMVNWNLFYVIAGFVPILVVGIAIIYLPGYLKGVHSTLTKKVDKKVSEYAKTMAKKLDE